MCSQGWNILFDNTLRKSVPHVRYSQWQSKQGSINPTDEGRVAVCKGQVGEGRLLPFSRTDAKSSMAKVPTTMFTFELAEHTQFHFIC